MRYEFRLLGACLNLKYAGPHDWTRWTTTRKRRRRANLKIDKQNNGRQAPINGHSYSILPVGLPAAAHSVIRARVRGAGERARVEPVTATGLAVDESLFADAECQWCFDPGVSLSAQ